MVAVFLFWPQEIFLYVPVFFGAMNKLVVLADDEEMPFALEFSHYLSRWFPQAHPIVRDYSHPGGGGRGNLVFAKIFFPREDYYSRLKLIRAEGNDVFILSKGLDDHWPAIQGLGLEGAIARYGTQGFYAHNFSSQPQHPSSMPMSAAKLLQQYAPVGFEQLKQSAPNLWY